MIIVTGGAGFIGSAIVWRLNMCCAYDIVIIDHLSETEKRKNLVPFHFYNYFEKYDFIKKLGAVYFENRISGIFNIGTGLARSWSEVAASLFRQTEGVLTSSTSGCLIT